MNIIYQPSGINNFHNAPPIALRISGAINSNDGLLIISAGQARRVQRHFCGVFECRCPGGAARQLNEAGTEYGINPGAIREVQA